MPGQSCPSVRIWGSPPHLPVNALEMCLSLVVQIEVASGAVIHQEGGGGADTCGQQGREEPDAEAASSRVAARKQYHLTGQLLSA